MPDDPPRVGDQGGSAGLRYEHVHILTDPVQVKLDACTDGQRMPWTRSGSIDEAGADPATRTRLACLASAWCQCRAWVDQDALLQDPPVGIDRNSRANWKSAFTLVMHPRPRTLSANSSW